MTAEQIDRAGNQNPQGEQNPISIEKSPIQWLIPFFEQRGLSHYGAVDLAYGIQDEVGRLKEIGADIPRILEITAGVYRSFGMTFAKRHLLRTHDGFDVGLDGNDLKWYAKNPSFDSILFGELYYQAFVEFGKRMGMKFAYAYLDVTGQGVHPQVLFEAAERAADLEQGGNKIFAGWFLDGLRMATKVGCSVPEYLRILRKVYDFDRQHRETLKAFHHNFAQLYEVEGSIEAVADLAIDLTSKYGRKLMAWSFNFLVRCRADEYHSRKESYLAELDRIFRQYGDKAAYWYVQGRIRVEWKKLSLEQFSVHFEELLINNKGRVGGVTFLSYVIDRMEVGNADGIPEWMSIIKDAQTTLSKKVVSKLFWVLPEISSLVPWKQFIEDTKAYFAEHGQEETVNTLLYTKGTLMNLSLRALSSRYEYKGLIEKPAKGGAHVIEGTWKIMEEEQRKAYEKYMADAPADRGGLSEEEFFDALLTGVLPRGADGVKSEEGDNSGSGDWDNDDDLDLEEGDYGDLGF